MPFLHAEQEHPVEPNPESRLSEQQVTRALVARGYPMKKTTMANYVTRGLGPPHVKIGYSRVFVWADVLQWIEDRTVRQA